MSAPNPPPVNFAKIAELTRAAETAPPKSTPTNGDSGSSPISLREALLPAAARVFGSPGTVTCPDCGATRERVLVRTGRSVQIWAAPEHTCPQREARLRAERQAEADRRREFALNPPEWRIQQVRTETRVPAWCPPALRHLRREEVSSALTDTLGRHRDTWLSGQRPRRGLWLHGPTDRRKTAALGAMAMELGHRTGHTVLYWNFQDLMDQLRLAAGGRENSYDPLRIEMADALILDDVGTVKLTETAVEVLYGIINGAVDACGRQEPQVLYVASNEGPHQLTARIEAAQPGGGRRIIRRLVQICNLLEV